MMNPRDMRNEKMLELLEQLQLPEEQIKLAEAYLSGEAGDEILGQMEFRDLSKHPSEKSIRLFRELSKRGKKEEASRLFCLLFSIGESTCYQLVPLDMLTMQDGTIDCRPDWKAAAYGMAIGMNTYALNGFAMKSLIASAAGQPENLKKAAGYRHNGLANGRLVLLAAYFMEKYKEGSEPVIAGEEKQAERSQEEKGPVGLLQKAGKLFGRKGTEKGAEKGSASGTRIRMEPEDAVLLNQYADILVASLGNLYNGQMPKAKLQEITDGVAFDRMTEKVLRLAGPQKNISRQMIILLGGMAYLNYPLSVKLKNTVRVCLAADQTETLEAIRKVSMGLPMDIQERGGAYDEVFGIDGEGYVQWAASKGHKGILKGQLKNHPDRYLKVMEGIGIEASNHMFSVVKEEDKVLYEKLLAKKKQTGNRQDMEKIIDMMTVKVMYADIIRNYLRGEAPVDTLYPHVEDIREKYYYGGNRERNFLDAYRKNYRDDAFFGRCQVYMLLKRSGYFFRSDLLEGNQVSRQKAAKLFEGLDQENLAVEYQLAGVGMIYDTLYSKDWQNNFLAGAVDAFAGYLQTKREETVRAFSSAEAFGRFFGLRVMGQDAAAFQKEILSFSQDSAKIVKEELQGILCGQKDWGEEVEKMLSSRKATERELAIRVLLRWQEEGGSYRELLAQALEKEKNNKIKGLLESALSMEGEGGSGQRTVTKMDLVKELHKGGSKRSLAWAYQTPFSTVHKTNGEMAEEEYLQAVLLCYAASGVCGVSEKAALLAENLQPAEFALYVNELFDKWMEAGAEAKKRWVLYAAAIHGGPEIIRKLQHQIQEWPQHARGAIAAEAVQALSLNPLPQALLIVDGISRKFKFKQIKAAAGKALEFAASQLGISREELADRIVPDLGFDERMERRFDYGGRTFRVTITPSLEIEVYDEAGKKLKNMPAPGKRDEEAKAAAAYEEFKQMKKQMKMTVNSQKTRLELALSTGREWKVEAWKQLFVKNPIMHQFAIGLIWGVYEAHTLVQSFRYMEDGSFNTEDEEEYELPENGKIGLVHPIELTEEKKEAWKQQLEDYEISQPIEQLERAVYTMTEEEAGMQSLERFGGYVLNDLSLGGKLLNLGWYRGSVQDAGGFYEYYREDAELGLGVELHFSGSFVGGENEDVTVYDARFYPAGAVKRGSYVYEEAGKEKACFLRDIPARYFSEIVWQLTKATASSQEKDENWKKEQHNA